MKKIILVLILIGFFSCSNDEARCEQAKEESIEYMKLAIKINREHKYPSQLKHQNLTEELLIIIAMDCD